MGVAIPSQGFGPRNSHADFRVPLWVIEYGFYASLFYSMLGSALGIGINKLGIVFLTGLACLSCRVYRDRAIDSPRFLVLPIGFRRMVFPICLGISYLTIQLIYHGESSNTNYVQQFIPWMLTLIVVQAIASRQGFLHRFAIFALLLGIVSLSFLDMRDYGKGLMRMGLDRSVGMSNPNALAGWFGFCAVYFYVLGVGIKRQKMRMASWVIAIGCLLVVTLTVSRGALLSCLVAMVLASREFLKRGFLPLLLLLVLAWIVYVMGVFDQAISFYTMRGAEETGRGVVWPLALESFINSPLTGVGASNVYMYIPRSDKWVSPHNGVLLIAMASGIIPLMFYTAYWIQATWAALSPRASTQHANTIHLSLVAYAFLMSLTTNVAFMHSWVIVTVAAAVASGIPRRLVTSQAVRRKKTEKLVFTKSLGSLHA